MGTIIICGIIYQIRRWNLTDKQISTAANEAWIASNTLRILQSTNVIDPNIRRRLPAIPIQDTYIAQSQPETITGPASNLPLVGVSLMTGFPPRIFPTTEVPAVEAARFFWVST